jgi:4-amino-4-deoxychorismate lyase
MLVNGARQSTVSVNNRGLAYGDGVFETLRICHHQLVFPELHLVRLERGLRVLGIADCVRELKSDIDKLAGEFPEQGVLKIIVTRGVGGRGYRSASVNKPDRILTLHNLPEPPPSVATGINAFLCQTRLGESGVLTGLKHLNRLEQVLASLEWPDERFHEGLMLDREGFVIEGTRSNVFAVFNGGLVTPTLELSGIAGVMRQAILEAVPGVREININLAQLEQASELFFCNSVAGIWPVSSLYLPDQRVFHFKPGHWCESAREIFQRALDSAG